MSIASLSGGQFGGMGMPGLGSGFSGGGGGMSMGGFGGIGGMSALHAGGMGTDMGALPHLGGGMPGVGSTGTGMTLGSPSAISHGLLGGTSPMGM